MVGKSSGNSKPAAEQQGIAKSSSLPKLPTAGRSSISMSNKKNFMIGPDEIISINVGGKKFVTRRSTMVADPKSRLADWFKTPNSRTVPSDKAGNYFLDRDGKAFRYILAYLRCKKEGQALSLGLPLKADDVARLICETDALRLLELKELCYDMLQRYQREEQNYVAGFVNCVLRDQDDVEYDKRRTGNNATTRQQTETEEYDGGYGD